MSLWRKLVDRFQGTTGEEIDWEALLIEADFGPELAGDYAAQLRKTGRARSPENAEAWLREAIGKLVRVPPPLPVSESPETILLVGVNGSGKTTTAAKLAGRARKEGRSVRLAAADTFRAAATEQLETWGARLEIPVTTAAPGTDPAAVAVRALLEAQAEQADLLIIDTAGRQANHHNLMQELGKVKRSLQKKSAAVPHHTWLVVDAMTGGGALAQAREFHAGIGLTGLIVTKLDGSARGGAVAAARATLGLPTYYLGQGERVEDLKSFNASEFTHDLFTR